MTFLDAAKPRLLRGALRTRPTRSPACRCEWSLRSTALCIAAVVLLASVAFLRWQLTGGVVPWDSKNQFYPMFRFLGDALRSGTLPLWNPYQFGGSPDVADPQSLVFTPSMILFALAAPKASMAAFDAVIFAHLTVGAIGMVLLARRWGWHPLAALLAALVYAFGASAASRLQHTGMIISYSWFPPALLALLSALDRRSLPRAFLAGVLATLMTLGRDQVAFLLCLTLAGGVAAETLAQPSPAAFLRTRWPVVLAAGATTLACMAVPILLTMQFLHGSNRPGIPFGVALEGSLDPANLLTMLAPNVFGSLDRPFDYWGPGAATVAGNDWTDRSIDYLFLGTAPMVLLLWFGLAKARLASRASRPFAILLVAALVYALGRHTVLFPFLFDWMPGVALYRRPADATFIVTLAVAFLSGSLLHSAITDASADGEDGIALRLLGKVAALAAIACITDLGLSFASAAHHLAASLANMALPTLVAVLVFGLLAIARSSAARARAASLVVALTAAQLLVYNCASPLNAESASAYSADGTLPAEDRSLLATLRSHLAEDLRHGERPRVEILGQNASWQNASMIFKLEDTAGYNPLRIADYERTVGVAESANDPKLRSFPDTFRGFNSRMASMLGLKYLVLDRPFERLPRQFPRPDGAALFVGPHMQLYRLATEIEPRALMASRIAFVGENPQDQAAALQALPAVDTALLDRADAGTLDAGLRADRQDLAASPSRATIIEEGDNRVVVDVDASRAGVLVLHDPFYPGWRATLDGKPVPVLKADLIFRGAQVPAGHHRVEFSFHPFAIGNLVSALAGLVDRTR